MDDVKPALRSCRACRWSWCWSSSAGCNKRRVEYRERLLALPGAVLEHLHDAGTGQVEVLARLVRVVQQDVMGEDVHERGVDARRAEDLEHLAQVGRLLGLVAHVLAFQPERRRSRLVPQHDDVAATRAGVGRALVGRAAELGDRYGLALGFALGDEGADELGEPAGDRRVPVAGFGADAVERRPVDALERERGVADLAAESLADHRDGPGEERVHTGPGARRATHEAEDPARRTPCSGRGTSRRPRSPCSSGGAPIR